MILHVLENRLSEGELLSYIGFHLEKLSCISLLINEIPQIAIMILYLFMPTIHVIGFFMELILTSLQL
jgi:hypothetical protein